jgi:hypothetical protein
MTDKGVQKPCTAEDEYFVREDAENKRRIALETKRAMAAEEKRRLKDLHWMRCPKCGMQMSAMRLGKIEVDTCFACGGIFLDKGEIEILAAPKPDGIMAAILNWFKDETSRPVK